MHSNKQTLFGFVIPVAIVCALTASTILGLRYYINGEQERSCRDFGDGLGLQSYYEERTGCRVLVGGRLVPLEMLRISADGAVAVDSGEG